MNPKNLEEARKFYYGRSWGCVDKPNSNFIEGQCIHCVVSHSGMTAFYNQCTRKASVNDTWCKQHDPEAVKARRNAQDAKWKEDCHRDRIKYFYQKNGKLFYDALIRIAACKTDGIKSREIVRDTLKQAGKNPEDD